MADPTEKPRNVTIRTSFENHDGKALDASAYLFDRGGALLASAPVAKGEARLSVDGLPRGARLFIGPTLEKTERASPPSLSTMERLSAFEAPVQFQRGTDIYTIPAVPELIWPHWPLCRCRVRGRVLVRRTSPGGVVVEAPVCNARVHICEVDRLPWLIARLPDPDIFRLRDELIDVIRHPLPWPPEPDPGPLDDIAILPGAELRRRVAALATNVVGNAMDEVALNPQPLPPVAAVAFNPQPDPPLWQPQALPQALIFSLASHSSSIVRRALLDHFHLIRPWICRWPWLHRWFYRCDELRVVTTDADGRFDTWIWYPCGGDKPDLYFWVEYAIGGTWTPVHRPPIPCHVWWDYPCGTEVTITVTDHRVPGCGDVPDLKGKQIVVKTIGREVSMGEINREPSAIDPGADPAKAGTAKPMFGPSRESPFGESLEPRVDFGADLKPAGISHYRWSYRPLGSTSEADWIAISAQVTRHYKEIPAGPLAPSIYKSVLVGPDPAVAGGYFFQVDPALPAGGEDWEVLDERTDLASAHWDTTGLGDGKYELKLELFRVTGGVATRIDLTAETVGVNQIVDPAPLSGSTYTATAATNDRLLTAGGHAVGYRLVIHVDNRPCYGTIEPVSVAPGANDTKCGFLEYAAGAAATIAFRASHPGNFASFDFNVARVATLLPSASASGLVDDTTANGFGRAGDLFSKAISVTTLLNEGVPPGEKPCTRAAFGESLHVAALATNGYGRLSGLDAPILLAGQIALRAFAITPA